MSSEKEKLDQKIIDLAEKLEKGVKPIKTRTITLEMEQESMEVFPIEDRIPDSMPFSKVLEKCKEMGYETIVRNSLIPYRNALSTLEKRYMDHRAKMRHSGYEMLFEPFIPEYMGFEVCYYGDSDKVYYKKATSILIPVKEGNYTYTSELNDKPVMFKAENMLMAYHILRGLGLKIDIEEILDAE